MPVSYAQNCSISLHVHIIKKKAHQKPVLLLISGICTGAFLNASVINIRWTAPSLMTESGRAVGMSRQTNQHSYCFHFHTYMLTSPP